MEELISVIVPAYNVEDYLPRCLSCIEMQTYKNLEIILVDDGSTDRTRRICDEFAAKDKRARVIHHPQNIGLWAARNTGQDAAQGDYIWMPDGDDYFHKDIVKIMYEAINQTNTSGEKYDLAIVGHKRTYALDEDVLSEIKPAFVEKKLEEVLEVFVRPTKHYIGRTVWSKLCRKDLIKDVRTGNYKYAQDCDFSLKVYLKSPRIVYVDQPVYYWLYRPSAARFAQDYTIISGQCVVRILYDNFNAMHAGSPSCRIYTLDFMYLSMARLLDLAQGTGYLPSFRREFKKIVRHTGMAYLNCKEIKTFKKRLSKVLKIRFDRLYRAWR